MQQSELSARVFACRCDFEVVHTSKADHRVINNLLQGILSFTVFADLLAAACEASALVMTSCQTAWYEQLDAWCPQAAELAVRAGVEAGGGAALPGMILNTSKKTTYTHAATGQEHSVPAGRMECTMQVSCLPANCCCVCFIPRVCVCVCDCGMRCRQNSNSLYAACVQQLIKSSLLPVSTGKICAGHMNA